VVVDEHATNHGIQEIFSRRKFRVIFPKKVGMQVPDVAPNRAH
jgi:hypothetical protein